MVCRKKPSALRRRIRRIICLLLLILTAVQLYIEAAVKVQLADVIVAGMKTAAEQAVNTAVSDFLTENADIGEKLASVCITESGTVSAITTDPFAINYVKSEIARRAQEKIDLLARKEGLSVPLGSFTGLAFLSAAGPEIRMAVESRSTISCRLTGSFDSAGINQTVHRVALVIRAGITVYNPFRIPKEITVSSDYEIARTVIVGSVPSYSGVVTY